MDRKRGYVIPDKPLPEAEIKDQKRNFFVDNLKIKSIPRCSKQFQINNEISEDKRNIYLERRFFIFSL
jgi:hypothetical protein